MNQPSAQESAAAAAPDRHAISLRYASLPEDKRALLRARVGELRIDPAQLPIVPIASSTAHAPLSDSQTQLWFLSRLEPDSAAYHMSGGVRLDGPLDVARAAAAVAALVERHETLRTRIVEHDGEAAQVVDAFDRATAAAYCEYHDLRGADGIAPADRVAAFAQTFAARPFDFEQGPLWRIALVALGEHAHLLLLTMHHVISDGWSMSVLVRDFALAYADGAAAHAPLPVQFRDCVVWQREWRDAARETADLDYWRERLGEPLDPLALPYDRTRDGVRDTRGARVVRAFDAARTQALRTFVRERRATVSAVLLAIYAILLARHSGQRTLRIGMPLANRERAETADLIGCFVNTIVVDATFDGATTFDALLAQIQQRIAGALAHQSVPFARVVEALRPAPVPGTTPVFQAMFNLLEVAGDGLPSLPGLRASEWRADAPVARFDITLDIRDDARGIECAFIYATDVFDDATVARIADDYASLVDQIVGAAGGIALGRLQVGAAAPSRAPLYWPFVSLAERMFSMAGERPDARAVHAADAQLDYRQLAGAVRALAARLVRAGVGAEERVGVCVQRTAVLPVALYGVLASGGAYVPLDPEYPPERLRYIVEDAGIRRVVVDAPSHARLAALLAGLDCIVVSDDDVRAATAPATLALPDPQPDQLAYVIYTSGSTGRPKGVGVTHRNVVRLLDATHADFGFGPDDAWSVFHSYAFDFSVWELFGALSYGGVAVIVPVWVARSPRDFHALLRDARVTVLNQTPSAFLPLTQAELELDAPLPDLRCVIFGGEKLEPSSLARWLAWRGPRAPRIVNMYGITETTVHVTARDIALADATRAHAPSFIGEPIADLSLQVLDADLNPAPFGVYGELCVGGAGLARGYLGRAALTAERFVPDPFGPPGARLYRSGDVARRHADGELEYVGRNDAQVKIRGFRIEPGEIQAVLATHPDIRSVVVVPRADPQGGKRLVAYWVGAALDTGALRAFAAERLPAHMVPAAFMQVDALPLTLNGKLDVRALPEPVASAGAREHVAPSTPAEIALAEIWRDVLGSAAPGAADDFFALGGHSLSAVKVVARVRERLGVALPLQQVFNLPVLRDCAAEIARLKHGDAAARPDGAVRSMHTPAPIARRPDTDDAPLSLAQERMWVLWQLEPDSPAYHVPGAVRLKGALDAGALRAAFDRIVARHDALRATFVAVDGRPVQRIGADVRYAWRAGAVAPDALADTLRACVREPFDLEHGPLLRVALLSTGPDEHVLAVVMHHIVSDGWSMNLLIDELCTCYEASRRGVEPVLPPLPIQCADHAYWERSSGVRETDLAWWLERLAGDEQPVLALPLARPRPAQRTGAGARSIRRLDGADARVLRDAAQRHGTTLFMLLLACYEALLHRYSGQSDLRIGIPVANRERLETESLIGFFINTLVIRADVAADQPFDALLAQTRAAVLDAQAHASVPFAQLVDALQPQRDLGLTPLFQAMFNLQVVPPGQFATLSGITVDALDLPVLGGETAQFDLMLDVTDQGDALRLSFGYATDVLDAATIDAFADHFVACARFVANAPACALGALPLAVPAGAAAARPYRSVPARVLEQAQAQPGAIALRSPATPAEAEFDRATLDARAARIGAALRAAGAGVDTCVGLCVARSPSMVAALFGIWRAGAAFVPLDPGYPVERLAQIVEDAGIAHVVVDRASAAQLRDVLAGLTLHVVEDLADATLPAAPPHDPHPLQLAYVMYTSGSTGKPKGVAMTHAALSVHVDDMLVRFGIDAADRVLQFSTINFDASLEQLLPALTVGARVVLRGPDLWSWPEFNAVLRDEAVTVADLPTAFWQQWLRDLPADPAAMRLVTVGGEALNGEALARWFASPMGRVRFENTYGPTEAAISALSRHTGAADADAPVVTIGTPYPGRAAYVLDAAGNAMPDGAAGELCLGGEALARGYLGRPAATAERFRPDPFGAPGARLYRTGDLCRVRAGDPARAVDYLGRDDRQVKLRGYRIELPEVEGALRALPGVREAVAIVGGTGDDRKLFAYAVADAAGDALHAALALRLPAYMMPAAVVVLDALPLTPNGKVDKRALPQPRIEPVATTHEPAAARDAREARLLAIWRDVLGRADIGVDDNFFALGGDSIQAIQAISRARADGLMLTVRELFEHQTIAALAQRVPEQAVARAYREIAGPLPLAPIQQWFFAEHPDGPRHWNQSVLLASDTRLPADRVEAAVRAVTSRHDALRLRFTRDGQGRWTQQVAAQERFELERVDLTGEGDWRAALSSHGARVQASLDLAHGPLWRATLFDLPEGGSRLLLVVHHLAVDGVSWRVLLEELGQAYEQVSSGAPLALPERSMSWSEWSDALAAHAQSDAVRGELDTWRTQLSPTSGWDDARRARGGLPLAAALTEVDATLGASRLIRRSLDAASTRALLQDVPGAYRSRVDEVLVAALVDALSTWSGEQGVLVELEGHGREDVVEGADLTRTVGWFTTRYPVWFASQGEGARTLAGVKAALRAVPHKGMHYGVLEYLAPEAERSAVRAMPRAQVSFNYLGQFGQEGDRRGPMRLATGEHAGDALSADAACHYALEMNALVVDGVLSIDWRYLPALIDAAHATAIVDAFDVLLAALIAARPDGLAPLPDEPAPSGFDSDLADDDLDALLDQIGD
ncbi:non-ribosomal peptide synthetase [Burkholderia paludis]|uniref:non-ribosomal peptide synthetase n=1 Tax=Burkholderia paludis TaxID=1506587 RepID=UPI00068A1C50|nr:non-ribosomal peptide synthetase [Burkholderia paludis]